jgi:hypothetical protein
MTNVKLTSIQKTLIYSNKNYDILPPIKHSLPFNSFNFCDQFFFLFQLNEHNVLNTYIYYQLPAICFGVCYAIFSETFALFAQKLYAF